MGPFSRKTVGVTVFTDHSQRDLIGWSRGKNNASLSAFQVSDIHFFSSYYQCLSHGYGEYLKKKVVFICKIILMVMEE